MSKLAAERMEEEAHVTELEDLLNSNLLKRQKELTRRLEQADVEADRCCCHRMCSAHVFIMFGRLQWVCQRVYSP